ncbi:MAG: PfkB family carbohydrate kinase [Candidatus Neomarinimicrobiota bacterium]
MKKKKKYDVVIFGNYTKDTIKTLFETKQVDGGGFNYGAHALALLGLKVAAVTRLSQSDSHIVDNIKKLGVDVYPEYTTRSTHMVLDYPSDNPDERILTCAQTAGSFTIDQFKEFEARAFLINASIREEVPIEIVKFLSKKQAFLVADVQSFIRIRSNNGQLVHAPWPEMENVLKHIDVLKADIVEARSLTGISNIRAAACKLSEFGPKEIVLTHRKGILVFADDHYYEAEFHPKSIQGRSGRGDTCIASYMGKRLFVPPVEAIKWSAAVTSLKLENEGPILRDFSEVQTLIDEKYR